MKNIDNNKSFENIKHIDGNGVEFWYARELMPILQYSNWQNFEKIINKAKISCENSGISVFEHFIDVNKLSKRANNAEVEIKDYELTRYACYLIAQNGDSRKRVIALAQTYFAIQTRRQEVADYFNQLDEDNKRLVIRGDIKQWNQMLLEAAHNAGVITNQEYAEFQNAGYMGLYGGLTVDDIHTRKKLKDNEKILDFMGSTELIANLFRISQTEEKLKKDKIHSCSKATSTHYEVGAKVRKAIEDIGGTMPEDLPTPNKSLKELEKENKNNIKLQNVCKDLEKYT